MISVRTLAFIALVLACALGTHDVATAAQVLTLALESPEVGSSPSSSPNRAASPESKPRVETTTIGRVGVVHVASAPIYRSRSTSAGKYAIVKADTPLAIIKEDGEWLGVLMLNGATGWISRSAVKITNYELVAQKPAFRRTAFVSRGGSFDRPASLGEVIVQTAMRYSGTRYVFGGTDAATGLDCSAFVRLVFSHHNIFLPRTAREQAQVGATVPFDQLKPGDRLYFSCKNPYIDHCGIYVGDGYFIHCSASRGGVALDTLASDFYWRTLVVAKRS